MSEPYPADAVDSDTGTTTREAGDTGVANPRHSAAGSDAHPDHDLSYEQARDALGEVVQGLETGGITLAESIALWERGERLANVCQRLLDGAQQRLDAAIERAQQDDAGY